MRRLTMIVCACVAVAGPVRAQAPATHDKVNVDQVRDTARQRSIVADDERAPTMRNDRIDLGERTVSVLDEKELQKLCPRVAMAEEASVGGSTVTISTTVIIIVLLVVILLLVA